MRTSMTTAFFDRFRRETPECKRTDLAAKILSSYADCVPVLLDVDRSFVRKSGPQEASSSSESEDPLKKRKFLAPRSMTIGGFLNTVRHQHLQPESIGSQEAAYVLARIYTEKDRKGSCRALPVVWSFDQAYDGCASNDGFLYLVLARENAFGVAA